MNRTPYKHHNNISNSRFLGDGLSDLASAVRLGHQLVPLRQAAAHDGLVAVHGPEGLAKLLRGHQLRSDACGER